MFRTKPYSERRYAMGTVCEITVYYRVKPPREAVEESWGVISKIESLHSRFLPESDVSRINRYEDFKPSSHTLRVVREALRIGDITSGAFDITCGPLMSVWKDFREEVSPDSELIESVRRLVDYREIDTIGGRIRLKEGMKIDLSGLAKGYACERAAEFLRGKGVKAGFVNCGGDIRVFGNRTFKIGIRHPRDAELLYTVKIKDESIVTSGDYESYFERGGERYHHIIDPKTGYPTDGCISATVVAKDATTADGLSTGIMVMGISRGDSLLERLESVRGLLVDLLEDSLVIVGDLKEELSPPSEN